MGACSLTSAAAKLVNLAEAKQAAKRVASDGPNVIRFGAFRLSDFASIPEPSPQWLRADEALKSFAAELAQQGGLSRMTDCFDLAAFMYGDRAVAGVSSSWDGCSGWIA